jgi:hypothetical protein
VKYYEHELLMNPRTFQWYCSKCAWTLRTQYVNRGDAERAFMIDARHHSEPDPAYAWRSLIYPG